MTDFEKLFCDNREFIFKYLLKLTRNASLAEELTQETFFRAYMNYSSLRHKESASVWLCQIAKNTYYTWYNEHKKIESYENTQIQNDSEDLEEAFLQKELSKKALACLHKLEDPYKKVFMLSVFDNFSLKDISTLFGKSESWARVTFYRAKQKLLEKMR
ncbi:MAG: sigma-70 family RNA polymerase sigma factor [Oscillospiraceae bacterium]|nr:sigma-70 family RNA polymerase sigma factor [Oscillospiraceae bacterium]